MNLGFLSDSDRETATVQLLGHSVGTCWRWSGNGKVHFMFPSDDSQTFSILLGHSSLPFPSLPSLLPSAVCVPLHTSRSLPLSLSLSLRLHISLRNSHICRREAMSTALPREDDDDRRKIWNEGLSHRVAE